MSIRKIKKTEITRFRFNAGIKKLQDLEEDLLICIQESIASLASLDSLYEIRNQVEDLIADWENEEIEFDDEDDEEG
mgnify:CR=1 FL=1